MKAIAPGKLIISGEHAVVYDKPALVLAVDRHATMTVESREQPGISLHLPDWGGGREVTPHQLTSLMKHLRSRYGKFFEGTRDIASVMHDPSDFFAFAAGLLLEQSDYAGGLDIRFSTDLPVGCGMGSSAAAAVSLLTALAAELHMELTPGQIYELALQTEKLQHGRPSGVDPYIAVHGGFVRFRTGEADPLPLPALDMWLINTGPPESSTGECVSAVRKKFGASSVWDEFEEVTMELEEVFRRESPIEVVELIRENHRLLEGIGVVPIMVSEFIADVEASGGAAKICGAGAVKGETAGVVLIFSEEPPDDLCSEYGYSRLAVEGEPHGARVV
ncbi:MAG: hypothetical protein KJ626_12025 [Verrucomicrobia bacterium]|nr:hypothetical protein [Verrucomicrobiota bacterium]